MSNITIKNLPKKLHEELKKQATLHHRSLNSEIINCLEETIGCYPEHDNLATTAKSIREALSLYVTEKKLDKMKSDGRA